MLGQSQVAALLIKVAASASIASILMRFGRIQRLLLADDRTVQQRVQLAFILALVFGATAEVRMLSHQYQAIDLAMEGAIIAGLVSYPGAAIGALFVGMLESFASFQSSAFKDVIVFSLLIPVLLWRSIASDPSEEDIEE